jgi:integrase
VPASIPNFGATATRLPETITQLPRELSGPEVRSLWTAAMPDARVVIAGLLGGLSLEELAALRFEHVDLDACYVRVPDISTRSCTLRDPLRRLLIERHAAKGREAPLTGALGEPLSGADLEGLIACAACDAGLANPEEVTSETLRHTYFAYLIRQGARLAEIGEFIGHVPPAAFRDYGRLSPPGPGLPLEEIDPVFPALRAPLA